MSVRDNIDLITKVQDLVRVRTRNATVNGVTDPKDIAGLGVEVNLGDLTKLIALAARTNGMIWNQEQWV